jgi:hypothetical protein
LQKITPTRFWISVAVYIAAVLLQASGASKSILWLTALFCGYLLALALTQLLSRSAYVPLALDSIAITLAVGLTGFQSSPLISLYFVLMASCLKRGSMARFVYVSLLSLGLYGGLLWRNGFLTPMTAYVLIGQFVLGSVVVFLMIWRWAAIEREWNRQDKKASRAETKSQVIDVLNQLHADTRSKLRTAMELIQHEADQDGIKAHLTLHKEEETYLPPSEGSRGILFVPVMAEENRLGTLILTGRPSSSLVADDPDYFSSLANLIGQAVHRDLTFERLEREIKSREVDVLLTPHGSSLIPAFPEKNS